MNLASFRGEYNFAVIYNNVSDLTKPTKERIVRTEKERIEQFLWGKLANNYINYKIHFLWSKVKIHKDLYDFCMDINDERLKTN